MEGREQPPRKRGVAAPIVCCAMATLTIAPRFCGPTGSGNGGYVAGALAAHAHHPEGAVTVSLRRPPPLGRELRLDPPPPAEPAERLDGNGRADRTNEPAGSSSADRADGDTRLYDGDHLVAVARPGRFEQPPVDSVTLPVARAAEPTYRGYVDHPFPECFVCGTDRVAGDGLRLAPGATSPGHSACTWVPDAGLANGARTGRVALEYVWSALDCPSAWASDLQQRPLVLGTITAECSEPPVAGRAHVVVGRLLAESGRKTFTASALYDPDGRLLGRAEQVWIAVDPATFSRPAVTSTSATTSTAATTSTDVPGRMRR